jgi:hypothetical protein
MELKMKRWTIKTFLLAAMLYGMGCEDVLEEKVYSELTPENYLSTENGKLSVLYSAYGNAQPKGHWSFFLSPYSAGEAWNRGGSIEALITPLTNFTWDSRHEWFSAVWNNYYEAIRNANIILDLTQNASLQAEKQLNAEARFIRGLSYYYLYDHFGPVPLFTTSAPAAYNLPRASAQETRTLIETDLLQAAAELPLTQAQFGRATKGAALGILCKFYLHTKQWQQAADIAQQIMALNKYSLLARYQDVFSIANEGNAELLWVNTASAQSGHNYVALIFPTDYPMPRPNNQVFAARSYFYDAFVYSFESTDTRKDLIVTEYVNTSGQKIQLLGNNQSLSGKFEFDPNAAGPVQGNDIPVVRYADILLTRAEALNELNGPTQETIDLINLVRKRAGASLLTLDGFTKESLRDRLLQEREWEFYAEMHNRQDQIRQGSFISKASARGKNAQPYHVLYPIPITEINANPNLKQNEGY